MRPRRRGRSFPGPSGIVYLAERAPDPDASADAPRFSGHWEALDPPALLEQGPGWEAADEAIAWGRERAGVVLIRVGFPPRYYSAGRDRPPGEDLPTWPPE